MQSGLGVESHSHEQPAGQL